MWEKMATLEAPSNICDQSAVRSPYLLKQINKTCLEIRKHIEELTGGILIVNEMILYFKQDSKRKLWLLYCEKIKIQKKVKNILKRKIKMKKRNFISQK